MRVIAGTARRLILASPRGNNTRPTSDKVKETLFNILAPHLYGASFLDLFAGSGGIGIEALSRGASSCTFVEKDKAAIACIRKNLETTRFTEKASVYPFDVTTGLNDIHPGACFDMVFMDPPYDKGLEMKTLAILAHSDIIDDDTMIIVESSADTEFDHVQELGFEVIRVKSYKNNKHVFLRRKDAAETEETHEKSNLSREF